MQRHVKGLPRLGGDAVWAASGFAIFMSAWWIVSLLIGREKLPSPPEVGEQIYVMFSQSPILMSRGGPASVVPHIYDSLLKYIVGMGIGITVGVSLGLAMKLNATVYDLLILPVEGIRTIPPLAFSPFLLLWCGPTALSAVLLILIYVAFMLVINTINAIENVPPIYAQFAETLGANRRQVFRTVILPAIIPELIGGLRAALGRAWGLLIVAELMGSPRGLGQALTVITPYFAIGMIIAIIILVTLLANATDVVFLLAVRRVYRWAPRYEG